MTTCASTTHSVLPERCLVEEGLRLAACGDFCVESSAQGAYLSGVAAAEAMAALLQAPR